MSPHEIQTAAPRVATLAFCVTCTVLAHLLALLRLQLQSTPTLDSHRPLPVMFNQFGVVFRTAPAALAVQEPDLVTLLGAGPISRHARPKGVMAYALDRLGAGRCSRARSGANRAPCSGHSQARSVCKMHAPAEG